MPIVFVGVGDPIASGLLIASRAWRATSTGLTTFAPVLTGKRLELLKKPFQLFALRCCGSQSPGAPQWKESQLPARELGLQLFSMEVSSADKYEAAFKRGIKAGSTARRDAANPSNRKQITELATKNRLPAIYPSAFVESAVRCPTGPDEIEPYKRAALMVDKILKGAKPADIPVEQPTKFELMINLKTAGAWLDDFHGSAHASDESHHVRRGVSDECRVERPERNRRR